MLKTRIASLALAGVLAMGGTTTAFAAESTEIVASEKPAVSMTFNKEAKSTEMAEKKATIEAKKAEMAEKKATVEAKKVEMAEKKATIEAMKQEFFQRGDNFEETKALTMEKMLESGKTQDEVDAMLAKMTAKFDEMKVAKRTDIAAKQAEREANVALRAEKGIVKGETTEII